MRLVVMQPSYLPWLGYFDLLLQADLFLVYDSVQFDKHGWRNRNRIKTPHGPQWITVPVLTRGLNKPTNKDILINSREPWPRKHLKTLAMNYRKAKHFDEVYSLLEPVLLKSWERLLDLNMACLAAVCNYLDIHTPLRMASELDIDLPEEKNDKLIALCRHLGANEFYEPAGGMGYIEPAKFHANGIALIFQNYAHPTYPQVYGPFVSHLSIVDLLMNCGKNSIHLLKAPIINHTVHPEQRHEV